ncbi:acyltransferase domain-containing protein [Hydrogenoanaerobacterium sp.]|uniref:acyltransferase domain-containing protein n=1 Tax=Hydrogenoanaerobacterium sp. TaxID=2953763 RepID=UPI002898CFC7|nr:acyltransferase domain-containing protein [Hydrogenoanaerobacterium sp.]
MQVDEFCSRIGLSSDTIAEISTLSLCEKLYQTKKHQFYSDKKAFYEEILSQPGNERLFLQYYIRFAMDRRERYAEQDISEQIYWDTFSDIALWERKCFQKTGIHGLQEYDWLSLHLELKLFRLGRLQFQPMPFPFEIEDIACPKKGQPVLNVHIPEGEKLSSEQIKLSYRRAADFFKLEPLWFICGSWLLSPALPQLLDSGSNILSFQKEFKILTVDPLDRQAEERIFGFVSENIQSYPEDTRLQKAAKSLLLQGGNILFAWGIRQGV